MNQAIAFPLKSILRKLITWEISRGKDTTKEDF